MPRANHELISPTAHYTGYVWLQHGLSHPAFATLQGQAFYYALKAPMAMAKGLGGPTLEAFLLARHRLIDLQLENAIESGEITQIIEIAAGLSRLLADSFNLYLMTHNFHWNVKGPMFNTLHVMFMAQYTEQWNALDIIAERIRALGHPAPGTFKAFAKLASIEEPEGVPTAVDMIQLLVAAQEATARTARGLFPLVDKANDQPTADLLTQRLEVHEKTAWMLRSLLEE